ncbi:MAG TPA: hypothetical protein VNI52_07225 [Sphingobacteriaceae bacterium]|nr:hypothetical protein [Sphingobacteriaceae bacterium]
MKKSLIVLTLFLFGISCKKNNDNTQSIDGVWVELSQKKDTLYFDSPNSFLNLGRGKELNGGRLVPKIYSGLYSYETKSDSISLQYMLSSLYRSKNYKFNLDLNKGEITIGIFMLTV